MIGCLRTRVRMQPIIALYFESENELKFYNLEARCNLNSLLRSKNIISIPTDIHIFMMFLSGLSSIFRKYVCVIIRIASKITQNMLLFYGIPKYYCFIYNMLSLVLQFSLSVSNHPSYPVQVFKVPHVLQ